MVVARIGDTDDPICSAGGCADGDYFMRLNVPFQDPGNPDPVVQLRDQFDAWRATLAGRPDAVRSTVDERVVEIPHPIQVSGMLQEATELILKSGRVSATFLQRRLRVDFQQAMVLLSELKGQGLINIGEGETHGKLA